MSRKAKPKPEPKPLPFFLELEVVARPWNQEPEGFTQRRDIYLERRDPRDPSARMPFLYHADCPLELVRHIIAWAELQNIPIVQTPPGNLTDGWKWPEQPTLQPKPEASF